MTSSSRAQARIDVPVRCLVIQLARLGDSLQSFMALRAAKQLYPNLEITFVVRETFSCAAKRVPWIHKVITLPTESLLGPLIVGEKNETQALADLARWIAPFVKEPWDLVVNWTFSEASSFLTALIPSRVKLGYTRRTDSTFAGADGWSHFIQGIVQGKVHQNIHITDVLTTQLLTALQIHVGEPVGDGNSPATSSSFFKLNLTEEETALLPDDPIRLGALPGTLSGTVPGSHSEAHRMLGGIGRNWISIQLGAAQESKKWTTSHWAKLIQTILQRHPGQRIILLGGKEDEPRAKVILEEIATSLTPRSIDSPSVISLVGKTSFDLWASVVSRSQWLFSGDTAAIHLASVLGVRVLNISVGPVRYFETGPYGNGHIVITSNRPCLACLANQACPPSQTGLPGQEGQATAQHTCAADILPEAVYGIWSYANNEWAHKRLFSIETHFSHLGWSDQLYSIRIYRSRIRSSNHGGGVVYEPMLKRPVTIEEWTGMVMGHLARAWYCGWLPPIGQELSRENISPALVKELRAMAESTQVLSKICQQASQIADSLNRKSLGLKSEKVMRIHDRQEIQQFGKTLLELENLLERTTRTHPALLGFSQMSKVLMHHLQGTDLAALGKETADSYRQLNEGVMIFNQWIQSTLKLVRPVAVKTANIMPIEISPPPPERGLSPS